MSSEVSQCNSHEAGKIRVGREQLDSSDWTWSVKSDDNATMLFLQVVGFSSSFSMLDIMSEFLHQH